MPRQTNNSISSLAADDILQLVMDSSLPSTSSASLSLDDGLSATPISQSSLISSHQPSGFLPVSSVVAAAGLLPSSSSPSVSRQALVAPSWSTISPPISSSVSLLPSGMGLFPSVPAVSWSPTQFVSADPSVQRPDQRLSSPFVAPMVSSASQPSWFLAPGLSAPPTQASSVWVQAPPVSLAQAQNQVFAQLQAQAQALAQA